MREVSGLRINSVGFYVADEWWQRWEITWFGGVCSNRILKTNTNKRDVYVNKRKLFMYYVYNKLKPYILSSLLYKMYVLVCPIFSVIRVPTLTPLCRIITSKLYMFWIIRVSQLSFYSSPTVTPDNREQIVYILDYQYFWIIRAPHCPQLRRIIESTRSGGQLGCPKHTSSIIWRIWGRYRREWRYNSTYS